MIKVAAIKPKERMTEIIGWRKELAYESQAKVAAWGLQV
jgi:eukaryotic translation initiation factor 2C